MKKTYISPDQKIIVLKATSMLLQASVPQLSGDNYNPENDEII